MVSGYFNFCMQDFIDLDEKHRMQEQTGIEMTQKLLNGFKEIKNERSVGTKLISIKRETFLKSQQLKETVQQKREYFNNIKQLEEEKIRDTENIRVESVTRKQLRKHFLHIYEIELGFRLRLRKKQYDLVKESKEVDCILFGHEENNVSKTVSFEYNNQTKEFTLTRQTEEGLLEKTLQTDVSGFVKGLSIERKQLLNAVSVQHENDLCNQNN